MIKHTIVVLTYNHEAYIKDCLISIFNQSVLPYEVLIFDDYSTDLTWELINAICIAYPNVKLFRNKENLGIYSNYEESKKYITGDVGSYVAGDDFLLQDCLKNINHTISINKLKSSYIIVTNNYILFKNGKKRLVNNFKKRSQNPFFLILKNELSYRAIGISKDIIDNTLSTTILEKNMPEIKYSVDTLKGLSEITQVKDLVFINVTTNIYRYNVGVTSDPNSHIITPLGVKKLISYIHLNYSDNLNFTIKIYLKFKELSLLNNYKYNLLIHIKLLFYFFILTLVEFRFSVNNFKNLLPKSIKNIFKKTYLKFVEN